MRLVGIDIGGTFTDLALYDSDDAPHVVHKVHSTPDDPAARSSGRPRAVRARRDRAGEPRRRAARDDGRDERGARAPRRATGWSRPGHARRRCTSGATSARSPTRSCRTSRGRPPVRRAPERLTVPERIAPPRGDGARAARRGRGARGRARARASRGRGGRGVLPVLLPRTRARGARGGDPARGAARTASSRTSADITPQFREFERFTTACMNAFVGPGTGRTSSAWPRRRCEREGVAAELLVMRSNGGVASVAEAAERPVTLMLSGPAAGVLGAQLGGRRSSAAAPDDLRHGRHARRHRRSSTEAGVNEASARDTQIAGYPLLVADVRHPDDRRRRRLDRLRRRGRRRSASARAARAPTRGRRATASAARSRRSPTRISCSGASTRSASSAARCTLDPGAAHAAIERARRAARHGPAETAEGVLVDRQRQHGADDPRRSPSSAAATRATSRSSRSAAPGRCTRPSWPTCSAIAEVMIPPHPGITSATRAADLRPALRPRCARSSWSRARSTATAMDRSFDELAAQLIERLRARRRRPRRDAGRALPGLPLRRPGLRAAHPGGRRGLR